MKAYIATSFRCKGDFHRVKQLIESYGHTVIHDWTTDNVEGVAEAELEEYLMACASLCAIGIANADIFILIARPNMAGTFVELGIALAISKPVIIIDAHKEGNQTNIFYHLPQSPLFQKITDESDLLALMSILGEIMGKETPRNPYDDIGFIPGTIPDNN